MSKPTMRLPMTIIEYLEAYDVPLNAVVYNADVFRHEHGDGIDRICWRLPEETTEEEAE